MIPFDLVYYRPESIQEALKAFQEADADGLKPRFLSGGTELVTMARDNKITARAFIDLKRLPETQVLDMQDRELRIGACVTLNRVIEENPWPLLSTAARGVADHSVRNTVTLGGNVAGMLPYREALLPFLVAGGGVEIAGPAGTRSVPVREIFDKRLKLAAGEFLLALTVDREELQRRHFHGRRTKDARVDYPLVSLSMAAREKGITAAVSGAAAYPILDAGLNAALSGAGSAADRAEQAADALAGSIRGDMRGSAEYRRFLLADTLREGLEELG